MTISNFSATTIREACTQFAVPIPKPVLAAEALHDAAVDLLAGIRAETVPDLESVTIKNMAEVHAQMVARTTWQTRERAAVEIEGSTEGKRLYAWHQVAAEMCEAFRVPFDKAAGTFTEAFNTLDGIVDADRSITLGLHGAHQDLIKSGADLAILAIVRDALATSLPFDSGRRDLDQIGRIITLPDMRTLARRIPGPDGKFPLTYWTALASVPGVVLKWHAPGDQQTRADLAKIAA